jgi:magnesium-transporting ATPase (P-type)
VDYLGRVMAVLGFVGIKLLTIVVVAVPEGFQLVLTISLAYSMHRMMADSDFVRRLPASETEARTMNQMTVEYFIVGTILSRQ